MIRVTPRRGGLFGLALAGWLCLAQGVSAAGVEGLRETRPTATDHALLEDVYQQTGARRDLPDPGWGEYTALLGHYLERWLASRLASLGPLGSVSARALGFGLVAMILSALAVIGWRWASEVWYQRRQLPSPAPLGSGAPSLPTCSSRPPHAWRAEIDRRLSGDEIEAALEAVWWWLAGSLLDREIDPSWTSRELLEAAGRRDLRPHAGTLDRLTYGPGRPVAGEVRALVHGLEGRLA